MHIETVTTLDRSLLHSVRQTLAGADSALLCVAFVRPRGMHLLEKELQALQQRKAEARLLVTTTFATDNSALAMAIQLGAKVRVLNPGAGSYHPKVYLGLSAQSVDAVVGSANLTGGLATNVEAGVWMRGQAQDQPLAEMIRFAERLWDDPRAEAWRPGGVAEPRSETFEPGVQPAILAAVRADPVFLTLGPNPRKNVVVDVTFDAVFVETERSRRRGLAEPIPAWMFNLAWGYLQTHRELTNDVLLNDLRVHRSSAVCAILARLPGVVQAPGRKITLRLAEP